MLKKLKYSMQIVCLLLLKKIFNISNIFNSLKYKIKKGLQ